MYRIMKRANRVRFIPNSACRFSLSIVIDTNPLEQQTFDSCASHTRGSRQDWTVNKDDKVHNLRELILRAI